MQYSRLLFILLPGTSSFWLFMLLLLLLLLRHVVAAVAATVVAAVVAVVVLFGCHFSFCNLCHLFCTFAAAAVASSHFLLAFRSAKDSHHVCHTHTQTQSLRVPAVCAVSSIVFPQHSCHASSRPRLVLVLPHLPPFYLLAASAATRTRLEDYSGSIVVI